MGFELDVLTMAFARQILDEIAGATDGRSAEELALLERKCPPERLRAAGLVDALGQFTSSWTDARAQALDRLPKELSTDQKLELVTSFFEMCVIDGQLDRDEGSLLLQAATMLGLRPSEFDAHLDTLTDHVGQIELDLPDSEG